MPTTNGARAHSCIRFLFVDGNAGGGIRVFVSYSWTATGGGMP